MTKGRKETTPGEQLWELRKARDRYNTLADRLRNDVDLLQRPEEKLARERDARRIAHAYEKSIENMVASCRIRRIDTDASQSGSVAAKFALAAFFAVAAGVGFVAVARPALLRIPMARIVGAYAIVAAPQVKSQNTVADTAAQMPVPTQPAVRPALSAPDVQRAVNPHRVVRATPPASKMEGVRQKQHPAKVIDARGESRFVAKVLQPDGTLKEQSFPTIPPR
jgi:hypothetical protein